MQNFIDFHPARLFLIVVTVLSGISWLLRHSPSAIRSFNLSLTAIAVGISAMAWYVLGADLPYYITSSVSGWPLEPQILSVSALMARGEQIYPTLASGLFYGQVYGPGIYGIYASLFCIFGASVSVAKWASFLALATGWMILAWLLFRSMKCSRSRLLWLSFLPIFSLYWGIYCYGIRPDPWLLLFLAIIGACTRLKHSALAASGMCVGFALLLSLKSSAALVALPLLMLFAREHGFQKVLWIGPLSGILSLLPFLTGMADFNEYRFLLENTARNFSWHWSHLSGVFQLMLLQSVPFLLLITQRHLTRKEITWQLATVLLWFMCQCGSAVISLKLLAASHHLMPYAWSSMLISWHFLARSAPSASHVTNQEPTTTASSLVSHCALFGLVFTFGLISLFATYNRQRHADLPVAARKADEVTTELLNFHTAHPDKRIAVGFGAGMVDTGLAATQQRSALVLRGAPYIFDPTTAMEISLGGVDVSSMLESHLRGKTIDWWLIPKGEAPFQCLSSYTGKPFFHGPVTQGWKRVDNLLQSKNFDVLQWEPPHKNLRILSK